ncbi:MAG TPA: hypothetical protein VNI77_01375 [Nitrososphaera sp.]|nr:hypothetical protein [Nitrososphaera sp.]
MGLSIAISGIIVLMTLVNLMMTIFALASATSNSTTRILSDRSSIENLSLNTITRIESIQAVANDAQVLIVLNNTGSTKLWSYDNFDVIVTYDANMTGTKVRVTEELTYAGITNTIPPGKWGITQFMGDLLDPQIVNPSEKVELKCTLLNVIYPNGVLSAIVSTDAGAVATKSVVVV